MDRPAGSETRRHDRRAAGARTSFAAIDLGTNNCRMLVAEIDRRGGFRVVDGYSQIVRLGEGLAATGKLADTAMARAYNALSVCAARIAARQPVAVGCIATQACRGASNGERFLARIRQDFGLDFEIITNEDEARLAVLGCAELIDTDADVTLIVDIGGGSTELSWIDPKAVRAALRAGILDVPLLAWGSAPIGVVSLCEAAPEPADGLDNAAWYESMVETLLPQISVIGDASALRGAFEQGRAHIIGTSGAVTSLAGVHLDLARYQRSKVDGVWLTIAQCRAAIAKLRAMSREQRAANPCIGKARADLVVPGGALLDAVLRVWPSDRIRVADRGLREGVLMKLIAAHRRRA